jgi:hypothetical protein
MDFSLNETSPISFSSVDSPIERLNYCCSAPKLNFVVYCVPQSLVPPHPAASDNYAGHIDAGSSPAADATGGDW